MSVFLDETERGYRRVSDSQQHPINEKVFKTSKREKVYFELLIIGFHHISSSVLQRPEREADVRFSTTRISGSSGELRAQLPDCLLLTLNVS